MIRITTLLWVALLFVAGGTVMHVSYQVRRVERHLSELNRDTRQEQDKLRILGAEWDTLNDPQRIDGLAKRYLALEPTPIQRVVALDAIPLKLSDDQIAKLAAATPAKGAKTQATGTQGAAKKPEILIKAPAAQPAPKPVDGVGLILARMEKHD
jgi:cell division protein FtsL